MTFKKKLKIFNYIVAFVLVAIVAFASAGLLPPAAHLWVRLLLVAGFIFLAIFLLDMMVPGVNVLSWAPARFKANGKQIALTFDDGPSSDASVQILDTLKNFDVKASFFCIGQNIEKWPEVARRMRDEGHCVANHSYSHRILPRLNSAELENELAQSMLVFETHLGFRPRIFRCPKGYKTRRVARAVERLGMHLSGFSYPVWDVENPPAQSIVDAVLSRAKPGDVVLMHDGYSPQLGGSRSELVKALPKIIEGLKTQGFEFVTLHEAYGW